MDLSDQLASLLLALGPTPDDVVQKLREANVHGRRHSVRFFNPIIRYVQMTLGVRELDADLASGTTVRYRLREVAGEVNCSGSILAMMRAFDQGAYPDLELPANCLQLP
jgi:hypothetical protein